MSSVLLAYLHPAHPDFVHHGFMDSVLQLGASQHRPFDLAFGSSASGPLISRARNMLSVRFLATPFDYLLFVDTDMVFKPDAVFKLFEADKPIVGALYYGLDDITGKTFITAMNKGPDGHFRPLKKKPASKLVKVDGVGMGLTLIKREVMEALNPDPSQGWPFAEAVVDGYARGEDLTFCLRAGALGYETWLCGDARAGHIKSRVI